MSCEQEMATIAAKLKEGQEAIHELADIRATLVVNFRSRALCSAFFTLEPKEGERTQAMMMRVLTSLYDQLKAESKEAS